MSQPESGAFEFNPECNGYSFTRKFEYLSRFVETDREIEYLEESGDALANQLKELFDKTPEELEQEGVPDEFKQTPLAFILPNQNLFEQLSREIEQLGSELDEEDSEYGFDDEDELDDEFDDDREHARNREGIFQIIVRTDDPNELPAKFQQETLDRFFQNEAAIGARISEAIFQFYRELQDDQPEFFDIKVDSPEDQVGVVFFSEMIVHETEIDGEALLGFHFDAEWEPEHGVGVAVHKGEVLDVGGWETAEQGPGAEGSVWYELCSPEHQKRIDRVARILHERWREQEAELEQDPYYQLMVAFQVGDMDRVRQLHAEGIDINLSDDRHAPLLHLALYQEIDPDAPPESLVEQLLEMGADPRVTVQGRTIIQYAQELLKTLRLSQKFLNADPSREMFRRMQAHLGPEAADRPDPAMVVNQQVSRLEEVLRAMKAAIDRR